MFIYILSFVGFFSFILIQTNCKKNKKKESVFEPVAIVAPSPLAQSTTGSKLTDLNDNVQMDVTQREDETELVMEEMELEEQQKQMKNKSKPSSAEKSGKKIEKSVKKAPLEIDKTQQMSEKEPSVEKTQNSFKGEKKENKTSQESLKYYGNSPMKNTGIKYSQDVL